MIRRAGPYAVFLCLTLMLLWPVLFGRQVLLPGNMLARMSPWSAETPAPEHAHWNALTWDAIAYFYPAREFLGRAISSGEIPLWNPHQMCGTPFLADAQSAALYPPNLLFAVLPADLTFGLLAGIHLLAAGVFMYVFLRGLELGRSAAAFGGVAFMLNGFVVAWLELPVLLATGVWLPLTLHLLRLMSERGSAPFAGLAGLTIALSLVAGHPQIAFYCLLVSVLYWVYLAVANRSQTGMARSVGLGFLAFAVGFALAAPQLLPTTELAALSHRGGSVPTEAGYQAYSRLAMHPRQAMALLVPDFYGSPARGNYWGSGEYAEYSGYIGVISLLLLPFALLNGKHGGRGAFFAGLLLLSLLMVFGTGVNRMFYFLVPGFARSGSPSRALFLFTLSGAVLAATGLDRLVRGVPGRESPRDPTMVRRLTLGGVLGLVVVFAVLWYANVALVSEATGLTAAQLFAQVQIPVMTFFLLAAGGVVLLLLASTRGLDRRVAGGLAVALLALDLMLAGAGENLISARRTIYPETRLTRFLHDNLLFERIMPINDEWSLTEFPGAVLPPNSATAHGLFDVQGYDALYPLRYKKLLDAAGGRDSSPPENGNMVFARNFGAYAYDLAGVRCVIMREPRGGRNAISDCFVFENEDALPRAFIVHAVEYASDEEILRRITEREVDLNQTLLVDSADSRWFNPWRVPAREMPAERDSATITRYTCNAVTLKVEAVSTGALVLSDQFYPGWKATVDGREARIVRANYAFRAVMVPQGRHIVRFSYEPASFRKGARIAAVALALILTLCIIAGVRAVRRCRGAESGQ